MDVEEPVIVAVTTEADVAEAEAGAEAAVEIAEIEGEVREAAIAADVAIAEINADARVEEARIEADAITVDDQWLASQFAGVNVALATIAEGQARLAEGLESLTAILSTQTLPPPLPPVETTVLNAEEVTMPLPPAAVDGQPEAARRRRVLM
jgi:hypothetical protein